MILVDSSLWIDMLIDPARFPEAASRVAEFATCGPVLQEVLQGLDPRKPESAALRDAMLALPRLSDPVTSELFLEAADLYLEGRRKGYTIRGSYDCLIAAIAIEHDVPVWHRDRDFTNIAKYTRLKVFNRYVT